MAKKLTGYLIDTQSKTHGPVELEDNLDDIYKLLHVDTIDIVTRPIGGKLFSITVDDNGLLKQNPVVSAVTQIKNSQVYSVSLVNSILILNTDANGYFKSLSEKDIERIKANITFAFHPVSHDVLVLG